MDGNWEGSSGDFDGGDSSGRCGEVVGKLLRVHSSTHNDDFKTILLLKKLPNEAQREVAVQRPLMDLVKDDVGAVAEGVINEQPQEDAYSEVCYPSSHSDSMLQAYVVAHG